MSDALVLSSSFPSYISEFSCGLVLYEKLRYVTSCLVQIRIALVTLGCMSFSFVGSGRDWSVILLWVPLH